jgi:hypothetical protein
MVVVTFSRGLWVMAKEDVNIEYQAAGASRHSSAKSSRFPNLTPPPPDIPLIPLDIFPHGG